MGDSKSWAADQEREEAEADHRAYLRSPEGIQDAKDMVEWNRLLLRAQTMTTFTLMDLKFMLDRTACKGPEGMATRRADLPRLRQIVTHGESDLSCEMRRDHP